MIEIELWQAILALVGVVVAGFLTGLPGILAFIKQAKKDDKDVADKRTETVLSADEAAWARTHDTIEDLAKKVRELSKEIEELKRIHKEEKADLEEKIENLEAENRSLKRRIEELEK